MANIESTRWIARSAVSAANRFKPNLFYIYLPHFDYAAQKFGPDSAQAAHALVELDGEIGTLVDGFRTAYGQRNPLWLVASEYVITAVERVAFPNRVLREAGLLSTIDSPTGEVIDFRHTPAWALADHQAMFAMVTPICSPGYAVRWKACRKLLRSWFPPQPRNTI